MRLLKETLSLFMLLSAVFTFTALAQDDIYYTPDNNGGNTYITNNYYGENYDDGSEEYVYYDDDDYEYYYSSRIRRFHRPYNGFGYYSGCYTDMYWYNPVPNYWGYSIYDTWAFRPNVCVNFGWGGWNRPWRRARFNQFWGWNNGFYNPYAWSHWHNPYYHRAYVYSNFYNPYWGGSPAVYVYNDYNTTHTTTYNTTDTHYGPRPTQAGYGGGSTYGDRPDYGSATPVVDGGTGKQGRNGTYNTNAAVTNYNTNDNTKDKYKTDTYISSNGGGDGDVGRIDYYGNKNNVKGNSSQSKADAYSNNTKNTKNKPNSSSYSNSTKNNKGKQTKPSSWSSKGKNSGNKSSKSYSNSKGSSRSSYSRSNSGSSRSSYSRNKSGSSSRSSYSRGGSSSRSSYSRGGGGNSRSGSKRN